MYTSLPVSWNALLSAGNLALEHREEIRSLWSKVSALWLKQGREVAFLGAPGVGKSVLIDHLTGTGLQADYYPPVTTAATRAVPVPRAGSTLRLHDIPGQKSEARIDALEDRLGGPRPVDAVVYVTAYGFTAYRHALSRAQLVQAGIGTLQDLRAYEMALELRDLEAVCTLIEAAHRRSGNPIALMVAVNKADLFAADFAEAEDYYSPQGSGAFGRRLQQLGALIGTASFRIEALPVCGWLERFEWNDDTVPSRLTHHQRNALLLGFLNRLDAIIG